MNADITSLLHLPSRLHTHTQTHSSKMSTANPTQPTHTIFAGDTGRRQYYGGGGGVRAALQSPPPPMLRTRTHSPSQETEGREKTNYPAAAAEGEREKEKGGGATMGKKGEKRGEERESNYFFPWKDGGGGEEKCVCMLPFSHSLFNPSFLLSPSPSCPFR